MRMIRIFWCCLVVAVSVSAAVVEKVIWDYNAGWADLNADAGETMLALKSTALQDSRFIVLQISRGDSCGYCKAAWKSALSDGVSEFYQSVGECCPEDDVYGAYPIRAWALQNKVLLGYVHYDSTLGKNLVKSYNSGYGSSFPDQFPMFVLLHVKGAADLTGDKATSLDASQVNIFGAFTFADNVSVNGVMPADPPTFKDFRRCVETFFPNAYWRTVALGNGGSEQAVELADMAVGPCKTLKNQAFTANTDTLWYVFDGEAGNRYDFYAYFNNKEGETVVMPSTVAVEFYASDSKGKAKESPMLMTSGDGLDVLDRGVNIKVSKSDKYYLKLQASGISQEAVFHLAYHASMPYQRGDVLEPYYTEVYPGKWTMNLDGAYEQAQLDGRDVIVYFTAALWCPYCINLENSMLDTDEFKTWAAENAYLVIIDNRKRLSSTTNNGQSWGPSLLLDTMPNGYLERSGLTLADGYARLARNANEITKSYIAPGSAIVDAEHGKPLGFPTVVYTRADGSVVGRGTSGTTFAQVLQLQQLAAGDRYEEQNNYTATYVADELNAIGAAGTRDAQLIGGMDKNDYVGFTVASSRERWAFTVTGETDESVTLSVYAVNENGGNEGKVLATASGSLSAGVCLLFDTQDKAGQHCRLTVSGRNVASPSPYVLSWEQTEDVECEVSFQAAQTWTKQNSTTLLLPVELKLVEGTESLPSPVTAYVSIKNETDIGVSVKTEQLTWTEPGQKSVELTLNSSELAQWNGVKSFTVCLTTKTMHCVTGMNAEERVDVYSQPALLETEPLELQLIETIPGIVDIPIAYGLEKELTCVIEPSIPWVTAKIVENSDRQLLELIFMKAEALDKPQELTVRLKAGDVVSTTSLPLTVMVQTLNTINPYGTGCDLGGMIYEMSGDEKRVAGLFKLLLKGEEPCLQTRLLSGDGETIEFTGWNELDSGDGTLTLWAEMPVSGQQIELNLHADGTISGSLSTLMQQEFTMDGLPLLSGEKLAAAMGSRYGCFAVNSRNANAPSACMWMTMDAMGGQAAVLLPEIMPVVDPENPADTELYAGEMPLWLDHGKLIRVVAGIRTSETASFWCVADIDNEANADADHGAYHMLSVDDVLSLAYDEETGMEETYQVYGALEATPMAETLDASYRYYLTYEQPSAEDGVTYWVPVSDTFPQDMLTRCGQDGWLHDVCSVVRHDAAGTYVETSRFWLAPALTGVDCCNIDTRPVAEGFYMLENGETYRARLFTNANNYVDFVRPARAEKPSLKTAAEDVQAGQTIEFRPENSWKLAVNEAGEAVMWLGDTVELTSGRWYVMNLGDIIGDKRTSETLDVDVYGKLCEMNVSPGWNLVSVPWNVTALRQKGGLLDYPLYAVGAGNYVTVKELRPGGAYWLYARTGATVTQWGVADESKPAGTASKGWQLSAEPATWSAGWRWNGKVFVPVTEALPAWQGGWFLP